MTEKISHQRALTLDHDQKFTPTNTNLWTWPKNKLKLIEISKKKKVKALLFNMYFMLSFLNDYYYSRVIVHCKSIIDNLSEGAHATKMFGQKSILSCLFCLAKI